MVSDWINFDKHRVFLVRNVESESADSSRDFSSAIRSRSDRWTQSARVGSIRQIRTRKIKFVQAKSYTWSSKVLRKNLADLKISSSRSVRT